MSQANPLPSDADGSNVTPFNFTWGHLNCKDPIFFFQNLNTTQLKDLILKAPATVRRVVDSNATQQELLSEVFRLRQLEATQAPATSNNVADSLRQLMATPPRQLISMAAQQPEQLSSLLNIAIQADTSLTPPQLPSNPHELAAIAISWQLDALKQCSPPQASPDAPPLRYQR